MRYTVAVNTTPRETRTRLATASAEDTERLGETIATTAGAPVIFAIDGELGAGKTQLVRGIASGLGIEPMAISSPTFVICTRHQGNPSLAHMDAYRIDSLDELNSIGLHEMLLEEQLVLAIEWSSRIIDALPQARIEVRIAHRGESLRGIELIDRRPDRAERERLAQTLGDLFDARDIPLGKEDACPTCSRKPPEDALQFKPFCSSRCRMADLGNWLGGYYAISRDMHADEELSD